MKQLISFVGLPFAGKTTFANLLLDKLEHEIVSFDKTMQQFPTNKMLNMTYEESFPIVLNELEKKLQTSNSTLIFDAMNITKNTRKQIVNLTTKYKYTPIFILVECTKNEFLNRLNNPTNRQPIPIANFYDALKKFEVPNEVENLIKIKSTTKVKDIITKLQNIENTLPHGH